MQYYSKEKRTIKVSLSTEILPCCINKRKIMRSLLYCVNFFFQSLPLIFLLKGVSGWMQIFLLLIISVQGGLHFWGDSAFWPQFWAIKIWSAMISQNFKLRKSISNVCKISHQKQRLHHKFYIPWQTRWTYKTYYHLWFFPKLYIYCPSSWALSTLLWDGICANEPEFYPTNLNLICPGWLSDERYINIISSSLIRNCFSALQRLENNFLLDGALLCQPQVMKYRVIQM